MDAEDQSTPRVGASAAPTPGIALGVENSPFSDASPVPISQIDSERTKIEKKSPELTEDDEEAPTPMDYADEKKPPSASVQNFTVLGNAGHRAQPSMVQNASNTPNSNRGHTISQTSRNRPTQPVPPNNDQDTVAPVAQSSITHLEATLVQSVEATLLVENRSNNPAPDTGPVYNAIAVENSNQLLSWCKRYQKYILVALVSLFVGSMGGVIGVLMNSQNNGNESQNNGSNAGSSELESGSAKVVTDQPTASHRSTPRPTEDSAKPSGGAKAVIYQPTAPPLRTMGPTGGYPKPSVFVQFPTYSPTIPLSLPRGCPELDQYTFQWLDDAGTLSLRYATALSPLPDSRNVLCVHLESSTETYIAFGISPTGDMIGGEAIIGIPSDFLYGGSVLKYNLGGKSVAGVELMQDEKQTLTNTTIYQGGWTVGTVVKFTKYLEEDGEHPILANGETSYLYALGSSNTLGYHAKRGTFTLVL